MLHVDLDDRSRVSGPSCLKNGSRRALPSTAPIYLSNPHNPTLQRDPSCTPRLSYPYPCCITHPPIHIPRPQFTFPRKLFAHLMNSILQRVSQKCWQRSVRTIPLWNPPLLPSSGCHRPMSSLALVPAFPRPLGGILHRVGHVWDSFIFRMVSTLKRRRRKMNKHKLRKRRKLERRKSH